MSTILHVWLVLATLFTLVALTRLVRKRLATRHHLQWKEAASHPERHQPSARNALMLRPVDGPTEEELVHLNATVAGVESIVLAPFRLRLGQGVRWLPSDPPGHNRKLGHLKYALAVIETRGRPVLVIDADVQVDEALIDGLLATLESGAALAWAAPYPVEPGMTRGLLVQSLHSFQALDVMSGQAKPLCGKAIALGPRAVELLRALPDCLGEDMELAQVLHGLNLRVELAGEATMPGAAKSLAATLSRFTRWMQVLRAHRPLLFPTIPLLFAATPLLALGAAVEGSRSLQLGVLILVCLRAALAAVLERRSALFGSWFMAELLLLICWLNAVWLGSHVTWRGRTLRVGLHGRLGRAAVVP